MGTTNVVLLRVTDQFIVNPLTLQIQVQDIEPVIRFMLYSDTVMASFQTPAAILVIQADSLYGVLERMELQSAHSLISEVSMNGQIYRADSSGVIGLGRQGLYNQEIFVTPPTSFVGVIFITLTMYVQDKNQNRFTYSRDIQITWLHATPPLLQVSLLQDTILATEIAYVWLQVTLQALDSIVGDLIVHMSASQSVQLVSPATILHAHVYRVSAVAGNRTVLSITPLRFFAGTIELSFEATSIAFSSQASVKANVRLNVLPVASTPKISLSIPEMLENVRGQMTIHNDPIHSTGYTENTVSTLTLYGFGIDAILDNTTNQQLPCFTSEANVTHCRLQHLFETPPTTTLLLRPILFYSGQV